MSGLEGIFGAVLCVGAGAWMLVFHDRGLAVRRRRHERALADRLARGSDAYFEELRDLHAYAPGRLPAWQRRLGGALLLIFGLFFIAARLAGLGGGA